MEDINIIAIIPARGGSKGVPRKNIKLVKGKPLIAYTIETAKKSTLLKNICVSTEDNEIASIAKKYGAEIIKRPEKYAQDDTPDLPVFKHAVHFLVEKGIYPSIIVNLRPTAPLRQVQDIDKAIKILIETGADSVRSFCEVDEHPYWMYIIESEGRPKKFCPDHPIKKYMRRQLLPKLYILNGAVDVMRVSWLMKDSLYGEDMRAYIMPRARSIDLNSEADFKKLELLL